MTAERVAMRRAAHQLLDDPKIFDDPVALRIIGKESALALQADPRQYESTPLSPYLRAFVAARSRYAEDELARGARRGVRQYVILGAGLDTFAYRNPYPKGTLHVFEVDHPATQAWKRARLDEIGMTLPADLTFAPVDFETQTLEEGLRDAGYDPANCTFFSWLGVTEYLTTETVMATLRFIASAPRESGIVFDYMISPSLLSADQRARFDALARRVGSAGEPWQAFFDPEVLTRDLRAMGFRRVEDMGPKEINAKYFNDRKDRLRVGSLSHLMNAQV
ncbi:MAG TPA: SAM-dependent methyltransferase [Thermodesulfobacteriota bacterium]|nr:SAM-dependent methyltransferase [Thermodesulfobacteriota bacterium]